ILGASVGATGEVTHERLDMPAGRVRTIVAQAIAEASRRLEDPTCQQVLTDFTDRAGHTLLANLIVLDSTTAQYLTLVWFVDAPDGALCRGTGTVAAFTQPGSRVVSVCAAHFAELPYSSREIVILHEMLHTLGLGENPPSSAEITKQVAFRCASSR
ncbi:MAG TPA: hypothetical protein VMB21_21975, partial [Candidatus Limnocylindria bacterium]|nr:hypothetical protein [Candidatus Limnocylindria bacterium]